MGQKKPVLPSHGVYLPNSQLVTMNKEILPANNNEKGESFLISVRNILQKLGAFFRFTEDDAFALLSAYGLCVFEVNRLQDNRPNEQKERKRNFDDSCRRNSNGCFPGPVPIGMHPDITRAMRTKGSQKHARR